jgi:Collagen triple helix repeat (20 copies)
MHDAFAIMFAEKLDQLDEKFEQLKALLDLKVEAMASGLTASFAEAQTRLVDFMLAIKHGQFDPMTERLERQVSRVEAFAPPAPGERGPEGPEGRAGPPGERGADGEMGERGPAGPQGLAGPAGERGEPGAPGERGADGEMGASGPPGPSGEAGPRGEPGERGEKGERGEPGEKGAKGDQGPPGLLPAIEAYEPKRVYYAGQCVSFNGSAYQAAQDTGETPEDRKAWRIIAVGGRDGSSPVVRGTFDGAADYRALDTVMLNGSSFIARRDAPGECPGEGWQCLAMVGKRGEKGEPGLKGLKGDRGDRGERGAPGNDAAPAPKTVAWRVEAETYRAFAVLADGSESPPLELRELFEQYHAETGRKK